MEISIIGLGSMGFNLALNLVSKGYKVLAYDSNKNLKQLYKLISYYFLTVQYLDVFLVY